YFAGEYDFIGRGLSGSAGQPAIGFGLPPTSAALTAYLEMLEGSGLSWSVAVFGGDVVRTGLARLALERGGHLRVGLEDYGGTDTPTNAELLEGAVAVCQAVGRPLASSAEAADLLGMT
uniref:3-keto-5-aminohexanoate cleavage protein n=1 Tax=uncultured Phenylobacterium sp. TaxID=349273 RepID=UPI0025E89E63